MRDRMIRGEAFHSEKLSSLDPIVRWTFAGLWCYCDDHGRNLGDYRLVHAAIYALDPNVTQPEVLGHLDQLHSAGMVCFYTGCDGKRYVHVRSWRDHQHLNRPAKSKFPPCPEHENDEPCRRCDGPCTGGHVEASPVAPPVSTDDLELAATCSNLQQTAETPRTLHPEVEGEGELEGKGNSATRSATSADVVPIESEGQKVNRLTKHYTDDVPLANFPAVAGVVRKAVRSQRYTDQEIAEALGRMAVESRAVTVDSLRYELEGFPSRASPRRSTTETRVSDAIALSERLAREGR